jgi:prolipoprotein diacylglyceryltransferase
VIRASGALAAAALFAGYIVSRARGRAVALDADVAARCYLAGVICGVFGGHAAFLLERGQWDATSLFRIWEGQSAAGLAAGAGVAAILLWIELRRRDLDPRPYLDTLAFAFPFTWALLRAGCALEHDHPGRYIDLGLVECLAAFAVAALFVYLARIGVTAFLPLLLAIAGAVRLGLEPLRNQKSPGGVWLALALMAAALPLARRRLAPR